MTTKYDPPSIDDIGPSFTSDEIYDSEVSKKFAEALEEQRIEKCFEEIKQVLREHGCNLYTTNDIEIYSDNSFKYYEAEQFNE